MKVYLIPLCILFVLCCVNTVAQTTLLPGDIAIVQLNSDNPDNFAFVALAPLDSGTRINFTDNGWDSSGSFRSTEGTYVWIASRNFDCGEVIYCDTLSGVAFSTTGDQLSAYQGNSSSPNFITAINNSGSAVWQPNSISSATSAIPTGLSNGLNAVAWFEMDNVKYTGITSGSLADVKAALFDSSNFTGSNANRQTYGDSFFNAGACLLPVNLVYFKAEQEGTALRLFWQTASEINNDYFEVQGSGDAKKFQPLAQIAGAGTSFSLLQYSYLDENPRRNNYYRLKQVDYDGTTSFYKTIYAGKERDNFIFMQNYSGLTIQYHRPFSIEVYSTLGNVLYSISTQNELKLSSQDFNANTMVIKVFSEAEQSVYLWQTGNSY